MGSNFMSEIRHLTLPAGISAGFGCSSELPVVLEQLSRTQNFDEVVFFVDQFFSQNRCLIEQITSSVSGTVVFIDSSSELSTSYIDELYQLVSNRVSPVLIAIGGGTTLDAAKAVSNLIGNGGAASDYQGWDLVQKKGAPKIAIPSLSGTGAETSRTCVLTDKANGIKLGMNSIFSVFDHVVLDPNLTSTVPKDQYFYTGMDSYIHSFESIEGRFRHPIADLYSKNSIDLCASVFGSSDMKSDQSRSNLMLASYVGGLAVGMSYVGLVHPLSAALSVVFGLPHCLANCVAMRAVEDEYPWFYREFWGFVEKQDVYIPNNVVVLDRDSTVNALIAATLVHEKPLQNAFGPSFREYLTDRRLLEMFGKM